MTYEVVVVGGGIGGLTIAALLSKRGVKVCLLERQPEVGGCISSVQHHGLTFDPGFGLYSGWESGAIFDRIFTELGGARPDVGPLPDEVVIRLNGLDIALRKDGSFNDELRRVFPGSAERAVEFYSTVERIAGELKRLSAVGPIAPKSIFSKALAVIRATRSESELLAQARHTPAANYLKETSDQFVSFIDAQLRLFLQTPVAECPFLSACVVLNRLRENLYSIAGGPSALTECLAASLKSSGGTLKLNTPVLRLAYGNGGDAIGVDLLSGERVIATRAIVSNMTIWDTYGKLVGLNRTPPEVKKYLNLLGSSGVYQVFASLQKTALERLPGERMLVVGDPPGDQFFFSTMDAADEPNLGVTFTSLTEVDDWFSFQPDEEDADRRDQEALEVFWNKLHQSIPEFGGDIEVLETATPKSYYEQTRRKLGLVMGYRQPASASSNPISQLLPNLFMIGDTATDGIASLESIALSALQLANTLQPK
ncbi:MAG TPA: FAD-dependent oxidoreductase [Pyrinomonadaceae bacterium]|nr:FAD-dependent oxidoreductase [Pyrinomonadaceae bacterium]